MNINKIKIPYRLRNNRDTADNYTFSSTSTSVSSGGYSWLENYVSYDSENDSLLFTPNIVSQGELTAWADINTATSIWDSLPIATDSVLGSVIIGSGLSIDETGLLSATGTGAVQTLDFTNNILSISDGNSVDLSTLETDLSGYATEAYVSSNFASISHTHNYDNYVGWDLQVNSGSTNQVTTGENVNFVEGGATNISLSGTTVTISSTDTNTWRGIDDTPVNGQTSESISSNWAYDHSHSVNPHNVTLDQVTDEGSTTTNSLTVGSLTATGEVTAYSDKRLKEVIKPTDSVIDKVEKLNIVDYKRTDLNDNKLRTGLIAQELKEVLPQFVTEGEYLSVNYAELVSICLKAIQELNSKVKELETKLSK